MNSNGSDCDAFTVKDAFYCGSSKANLTNITVDDFSSDLVDRPKWQHELLSIFACSAGFSYMVYFGIGGFLHASY